MDPVEELIERTEATEVLVFDHDEPVGYLHRDERKTHG